MPSLRTSDHGNVRVLTLNRPEVRNALDRRLRESLLDALDAAEGDEGVRAVVITGSGGAFCSGMDLAELEGMLDLDEVQHLADSRALSRLFRRIYTFPKPTVAAVDGHAIAGGAGLASVCDLVVMSEDAKIGYTEARIGFVAALVGVYLVRLVGERHARRLLLEARPVGAAEAREMGLVNEVLPAAEVRPRALELASRLARNSPAALRASKELLAGTAGVELSRALESAELLNARARSGEDMREGVRAFLEKRPPRWVDGGDA